MFSPVGDRISIVSRANGLNRVCECIYISIGREEDTSFVDQDGVYIMACSVIVAKPIQQNNLEFLRLKTV